MIKKIFYISFSICLIFFIYWLSLNNGKIIIDFVNYQVITTTNFVICSFVSVFLFFRLLCGLKKFIFRPENLEKKFNNYMEYITKGFIYCRLQKYGDAIKNLNKGKKIYNSNLTKYLEYLILNGQNKYNLANQIFGEISIKEFYSELLKLKLDYVNSKENGDIDSVEKIAKQIIDIEPRNSSIIKNLLSICMSKCNWLKANEILGIGLKMKIFDKKSSEFFIINKKLGEEYYSKNYFDKAKEFLENAYQGNKNEKGIHFALAKTYLVLGERNKSIKIMETAWKYIPSKDILDLYFSMGNNPLDKIRISNRLIKINSKTFYSYYASALAYYQVKQYENARKNLKIAEKIGSDKMIYELLLKIETETSANVTTINLLKNKINQFCVN